MTRPMFWSIRRELWENRSIYAAPLAVAVLFLAGFLTRAIVGKLAPPFDPSQTASQLAQPFSYASLAIMATTFLVALFYCLDALHGERRDRSILFWKSLPVSDRTTVLSKAFIPIVLLPLLTFAITVALQLIMLVFSSVILLLTGQDVIALWSKLPLFSMSVTLLYHLVAVHGLYYAPIFCWLLLVSAWARRLPFLWATLPVLAIVIFERVVSNTSRFASALGSRISGGSDSPGMSDMGSTASLSHIHLSAFLGDPGLWAGLVASAVFLALAMYVRRNRDPI